MRASAHCVARLSHARGAALLVPLALAAASGGCEKRAAPATLAVAAAADLTVAFGEIGPAFERATGQPVAFSFGSTGLLAKQIEEGAPFRVFAAASVAFVDRVVDKGACLGETKAVYARGALAIFRGAGSRVKAATLADLAAPAVDRIAIANPEHAPYGAAAVDALRRAGLYDAVKGKLVFGENVRQALQFAATGNATVALVARSLEGTSPGEFTPVDPALHAPIEQAIVVCKGTGPDARADGAARGFAAFVASPDGRAILARHGFLAPP
jgi:molybdate transport system substrate-binding protein